MVFTCSYKTFLLYAVDWFSRKDLLSFKYICISEHLKFSTQGTTEDKLKIATAIFPSSDILEEYRIDRDYVKFRDKYMEELDARQGLDQITFGRAEMADVLAEKNIMYLTYDEEDDFWSEVFNEWLSINMGITPYNLNRVYALEDVKYIPPDMKRLKKIHKNVMKHWRETINKNAYMHPDDPGYDKYRFSYLKDMKESELDKYLHENGVEDYKRLTYNEKFAIAWDIVRAG